MTLRSPPPLGWMAKKAQWRAKKTPSLLQTFCKKAQWRAKKLRERGSNAARQPKKGGGGLPIRSRFGRDSVAIGRDSVQISTISARRCLVDARGDTKDKAQRRQNVAKNRLDFIVWACRCPADTLPTPEATPCRHPRRHPRRHPADFVAKNRLDFIVWRVEYKPKHKKKPDS